MTKIPLFIFFRKIIQILQILSPVKSIQILQIIWPVIVFYITIKIFLKAIDKSQLFIGFNKSQQSSFVIKHRKYIKKQCKVGLNSLYKYDIVKNLISKDIKNEIESYPYTPVIYSLQAKFDQCIKDSSDEFKTYLNYNSNNIWKMNYKDISPDIQTIYNDVITYLHARNDFGKQGYRVIYDGDAVYGGFRLFRIKKLLDENNKYTFYSVYEIDHDNDDKSDSKFYVMCQYKGSKSISELGTEIIVKRFIKNESQKVNISNDSHIGYSFGSEIQLKDLYIDNDKYDSMIRIDLVDDDDNDNDNENESDEDIYVYYSPELRLLKTLFQKIKSFIKK